MENRTIYRITLPSHDVQAFLGQCEASDWHAFDTGERIMTEDGPDGEAVLLIEPTGHPRMRTPATLRH